MTTTPSAQKNGHRALSPNISAMTVQNNETQSNKYKKESAMTHQPTRNPLIPANFTCEIDPITGGPTGLYWGPCSENEAVTAFILDTGPASDLEVEYSFEHFTDMSYLDAEDYCEEVYQFLAAVNTWTVFGENHGRAAA
ncbi:hypothetical protein [Rothia halotolerans]|uniref:hypothetical protein n=1 Tax=Rothia halotolerans TaxID=405770 RepID=UPI00101CC46F|nr:hypothetical protein [Rothia halotolerans]